MKKIYYFIALAIIMFIPFNVKAEDGIEKFYVDATIQENGSIVVKEAFIMNGEYNGFDRIIKYANDTAPSFNPDDSKYGGTSLHNGSGIVINKIMGIDSNFFSTKDFSQISGDLFESSSYKQSYGSYLETNIQNGKNIRIYNPYSTGKAFYVEYTILDMAILNNDVGEIGWNVFGDELNESIGEFEMTIHLPNNKKELRAWAHGPLNGNIKIVDQQTVLVTINSLSSNRAFDVRLAFDRDVIKQSTKINNATVLDKILNYEQEKADEANKERTDARILYYSAIGIVSLWVIGLIVIVIRVYLKYDKEYQNKLNVQYYREFPNTYNPEIVGYLFHKKIGTDDLSSSIMNLIYKKIIRVEEIPGDKKDYKFIYNRPDFSDTSSMTAAEQKLVAWLFDGKMETSLGEFKKSAKGEYDDFLDSYNSWNRLALKEAESYNFYEKNKIGFPIIYSIIGIALGIFLGTQIEEFLILVVCLVLGIGSILYFALLSKRSLYGNDEYNKWKAFKNFLVDFGNFSDKELPEIVLWEKYLVYAITLGCASKLAKTMEIKAAQLYPAGMPTGYYYHNDFYFYVAVNRMINNSVNSAVSDAISTKTAATSSNSSGSGFGGGFSSGGGSFGGGGGGGRF